MSSPIAMVGLRPEQAPPLVIPASFFLLAPIAIGTAGAILALCGQAPLVSTSAPLNIAAVHLGTLGFVSAVMLGALYQMIPVVAGAPVPQPRIAHAVHAGLIAGLTALAFGMATGSQLAFWIAFGLLGSTLAAFVIPIAAALVSAPAHSHTVIGMRLALLSLVSLASVGLIMVWGRAGPGYFETWTAWRHTHVSIGFVGWVGGLLTAVSWQVVPMFYLTDPAPTWSRRAILIGVGLGTLNPLAALVLGLGPSVTVLCAMPGAAAIWLLHPAVTARALWRRRRRRADPSVLFWWCGLGCGPLAFAAGIVAEASEDARWPVLFGWLVLWGWAGHIIEGMLSRIVPFLVWFHRFAPLAGHMPIPPMRHLLPDRRARVLLGLHVSTLVIGAVAIVSGDVRAARLLGIALFATGLQLGGNLIHILRQRPAGAAPAIMIDPT